MANDVDVVIVGAGAAGLSAAKKFAELGASFVLLEASHRIGGRAYTEEIAPNVPFDLGCHWMHSASLNPFVAIADELGFHYAKDIDSHACAFMNGEWLSKERMDDLRATDDAMYAAFEAAAADGKDVAAADLIDLDSQWLPFLVYWFSLGASRDIDQVSIVDIYADNDTHENWPLREGYGALVARWAADVPVTLNAPVHRVRWDRRCVNVESAKGTVTGKKALVCVSTNVLASGAITFEPALPNWKLEAIGALPLGTSNRIGVLLKDDPFGWDASKNATIMLEGDEVPMLVQVKPFGFPYVVGFTGGRFGSWLEHAGQQASVDYLTERLVKTFGSGVAKSLSERVIVTAWENDPWTLGSYSAATPGNGHMRAELARPIDDTIFFAGEATHTSFFPTCHGAYLSGIDQAKEIAEKLQAPAPIQK